MDFSNDENYPLLEVDTGIPPPLVLLASLIGPCPLLLPLNRLKPELIVGGSNVLLLRLDLTFLRSIFSGKEEEE
jgi:hypothetical protein